MLYIISRLFTLSLLLLDVGVQSLPNAPNARRSIRERALHNVTSANKAGLGWNNPQNTRMKPFLRTGKVGWYYTWSSWPNDQGDSLDFVPLLWGSRDIETWTTAVTTRLKPMFQSKAITAVLGFNEPQETGQSNLTVEQALPLWMANLQPLKAQYGVRLGSPAPSSAPNSKNWTAGFLQACRNQTGCSVDFIALHYYGTNATDMIAHITDFHSTFQMPIWVTEWACQDFTGKNSQCDQEDTKSYMNMTQTFMEKTDWVERYSWFGALVENPVTSTNDLLTNSGSITTLGQQYIQETPEQISQVPEPTSSPSSPTVITRTGTRSLPAYTFTALNNNTFFPSLPILITLTSPYTPVPSVSCAYALNLSLTVDSSGQDPSWSVGGVPSRFQGGPLGLLGGDSLLWLLTVLLVSSLMSVTW